MAARPVSPDGDDIALVTAMAAAAGVLVYLTCRAVGWIAAAVVLAWGNR